MNFLVTGAAGFTGRALVAALARQHPQARITGYGPREPDSPVHPSLTWVTGSAGDPEHLAQALTEHRISHLAHLARASRGGDETQLTPEHVGLTLGVLMAAARAGSIEKVLVLGSAAEYGLVREDQLPIREDRVPAPGSAYGYAKLAESRLALLSPDILGVPALVARVFNPVGPAQGRNYLCGSLVAQFRTMIETGKVQPLSVGALPPIRDFVDVRDVAEALGYLLLKGSVGEIYNVGSGSGTRVNQVIELLSELTGLHPPVPDAEVSDPATAEHSVAEVSRLEAATGYCCTTPLRDTLKRMLAGG